MNRTLRILQSFVFFLSATAVWFLATTRALAADAPPKAPEAGVTDYTLSYMLVILGIALGLLVVAKPANRRERERPAGYVQKNIIADK